MIKFANQDSNYFDLKQLSANYETITQPLYDILDYPDEGGSLRFFAIPLGAGDPPKTYADTNLFLPSQIPTGQAFVIESIRVQLMLQSENRGDERRFYSRGQFSFQIGSKTYLNAVAGELDPRRDPEIRVDFNTSGTQCEVTIGSGELDQAGVKLSPNQLLLIPHQYFSLSCDELPRLKNEARLRAILYGKLMRQLA